MWKSKELRKIYYQKNREKICAYQKAWRENHLEIVAACMKKYNSRPEIKAKRKEYYSRPEIKESRKKLKLDWDLKNKEHVKEYNHRPENIEKRQRATKLWKIRNPLPYKKIDPIIKHARNVINRLINVNQKKKIIRPTTCSNCGANRKVQAHHPDYFRPLKIEWLCSSCHKNLHLGR